MANVSIYRLYKTVIAQIDFPVSMETQYRPINILMSCLTTYNANHIFIVCQQREALIKMIIKRYDIDNTTTDELLICI